MTEKTINVLYIEDDIEVIASMNFFLNMSFKKVYLCNNGKEALNTFIQYKDDIHLIITELDIPTLNGIEMIKKIKEIKDDIPIFIVSAQIDLIEETKKLGVKKFFKKPVLDIFEIKNTINKYL
ncbi:MAG: response regulator [Sulfurovum sp.]|jgi:response regulator RpfG family c-di-GMP phosphodiesterase